MLGGMCIRCGWVGGGVGGWGGGGGGGLMRGTVTENVVFIGRKVNLSAIRGMSMLFPISPVHFLFLCLST